MSEWQPIETYDTITATKKPLAVFWVKATAGKRNNLRAMAVLERQFGFREITHWMPLPEPPEERQ